eukprot:2460283-Prymnesium_polylepis.1
MAWGESCWCEGVASSVRLLLRLPAALGGMRRPIGEGEEVMYQRPCASRVLVAHLPGQSRDTAPTAPHTHNPSARYTRVQLYHHMYHTLWCTDMYVREPGRRARERHSGREIEREARTRAVHGLTRIARSYRVGFFA